MSVCFLGVRGGLFFTCLLASRLSCVFVADRCGAALSLVRLLSLCFLLAACFSRTRDGLGWGGTDGVGNARMHDAATASSEAPYL